MNPYLLGLSCFGVGAFIALLWGCLSEAIENRYRAPRYRSPWSSDL